MASQPPILLFDGVCNLCNSTLQFILSHDRENKFQFGSLQGPAGQELLVRYGLAAEPINTFVLIVGQKAYLRSGAALRVARMLGFPWSLMYIFILVPPFIRDGIYNWVSRNRYRWFGKSDSCWIPLPQWKSRSLDEQAGESGEK